MQLSEQQGMGTAQDILFKDTFDTIRYELKYTAQQKWLVERFRRKMKNKHDACTYITPEIGLFCIVLLEYQYSFGVHWTLSLSLSLSVNLLSTLWNHCPALFQQLISVRLMDWNHTVLRFTQVAREVWHCFRLDPRRRQSHMCHLRTCRWKCI